MSLPNIPRLAHIHIPKTAGMAVRQAFIDKFGHECRFFSGTDDAAFEGIQADDYDFFGGHFGFNTAIQLKSEIITVLRNPIDRFVSVYYFWRQLFADKLELTQNTQFAAIYPLEVFTSLKDQPGLIEEFHNRMTWQLAIGSSNFQRERARLDGLCDDDIFKMAVSNLDRIAIVGFQERLSSFSLKLEERMGLNISIPRENVTHSRLNLSEVSMSVRRQIQSWTYMDLELYNYALAKFA